MFLMFQHPESFAGRLGAEVSGWPTSKADAAAFRISSGKTPHKLAVFVSLQAPQGSDCHLGFFTVVFVVLFVILFFFFSN